MNVSRRKLVTIITEAALEHVLAEALEGLGARGYTVIDVRGKGSHGPREAGWGLAGNIQIEVVCGEELAKTIVEHLQANYYNHYAMITYVADVDVLRPGKF